MKTLGLLSILLVASVQAHALTNQEFVGDCLSQVTLSGRSGPDLVCRAATRADAEKLASIGINPSFKIDASKAGIGTQTAQGRELKMDLAIPLKGLVFKKYLRVQCTEQLDSSVRANQGITVDIENRIDFTASANVLCE